MRRIVAVLSMIICMLGALAMLFGAVAAWTYVIAVASSNTHWTIGAALLVISLWVINRYQDRIMTPWRLWRDFWSALDAELERRTHKGGPMR